MAGSKRDNFETDLLELVFTNLAIANIGDGSGLQPAGTVGSLWVALYTVAPTDSTAGTEAAYTSYAREAVARSAAGWTVAGNNCSNAAEISFTTASGGTETEVAFAIMTALTGGDMLYWGDLTANLDVSTGITPKIAIGDLDITED